MRVLSLGRFHLLDIVSNQFNTYRTQADVYLVNLLMAANGESERELCACMLIKTIEVKG